MVVEVSLVGVAAFITVLIAVTGGVILGAVAIFGKYSRTESETAGRTIELQKEEIDAVRRRLDQVLEMEQKKDTDNRQLMQRVAELAAAEQLLEKERENVVKLTNALRMMRTTPEVVDVDKLIGMVTAAASGAEVKRVNGEGHPPQKPKEQRERRTVEEDIRRRVVEVEDEEKPEENKNG